MKMYSITIFYPHSQQIRYNDVRFRDGDVQALRDEMRILFKCAPTDLCVREM